MSSQNLLMSAQINQRQGTAGSVRRLWPATLMVTVKIRLPPFDSHETSNPLDVSKAMRP